MTDDQKHPPHMLINGLLRRGFGAEDIALKLEMGPEKVRAHIRRLRAHGLLIKVLGIEK